MNGRIPRLAEAFAIGVLLEPLPSDLRTLALAAFVLLLVYREPPSS